MSYMIGNILGWLAIPAAIFLIAVLMAKPSKTAGWVIYAGGAILSCISLIGDSRRVSNSSAFFGESVASTYQSAFMFKLFGVVVLAAVAAYGVSKRGNK